MCKTFGDGQLWMISFSSGKKKKKTLPRRCDQAESRPAIRVSVESKLSF
jgi:hypothetical protein